MALNPAKAVIPTKVGMTSYLSDSAFQRNDSDIRHFETSKLGMIF